MDFTFVTKTKTNMFSHFYIIYFFVYVLPSCVVCCSLSLVHKKIFKKNPIKEQKIKFENEIKNIFDVIKHYLEIRHSLILFDPNGVLGSQKCLHCKS